MCFVIRSKYSVISARTNCINIFPFQFFYYILSFLEYNLLNAGNPRSADSACSECETIKLFRSIVSPSDESADRDALVSPDGALAPVRCGPLHEARGAGGALAEGLRGEPPIPKVRYLFVHTPNVAMIHRTY